MRTTRSGSSWLWLLGGLLGAALVVALSYRFPKPLAADAAAERFSAERAMRIVRLLCDGIGMRPNGTPAQERAVAALVAELRKVPGLQVEVQRAGGVHQYQRPPWPFPTFVYRTTNVVARLEGRTREALLLDAHYDTLTDGVGAGDDALGVGAMVEVMRALAAGPKLERSVVLNLNGAEEIGTLGAAAFLQHPLAKDVRAYLYVDSGPRGRPVVIGAGPGNAWLLEEYTAAAGSVSTSVVGQDLIENGLLPHNGDFLPFHEAGMIGIDVAAVDDFWAIHTDRDRPERIDAASLQLMGENLLAGARRLASGALPGNVDGSKTVYYDVAGLFVPVYRAPTARALAVAVLGLAACALVLAVRRRAFTARRMLRAFGRTIAVVLAAVLAAVLVAALLGLVARRPHGWFARPALAVWTFGASAIAAALGVQAWRRRRTSDEPDLAPWGGALLFWALLLGLSAWKNLGSGYLPLWWTGFLGAGLIGALYVPAWRDRLWLASFLPGAVLVMGLVSAVLPFLVADTGLVPASMPLDVVVAMVVVLGVVGLLPAALVVIAHAPRVGRASLVCAAVALVGAIVSALVNPYTVERPKRVLAALTQKDGTSGLIIDSQDALPLGPVLRDVPEAVPVPPPLPSALGSRVSYRLPAAPPSFPPPRIEVLSSVFEGSRGVRVVRLRLVGEGPRLGLFIPRPALRAWSLGKVPDRPERLAVAFEGASPADKELTLELAGADPVEIELLEVRGPSRAPEVMALERRLPPWVAFHAREIWSVKKKI